jgi:hypothetical protein
VRSWGNKPGCRTLIRRCSPPGRSRLHQLVVVYASAVGGKNLEVFSPTIGRQLLELGLIDEIDLYIATAKIPTESVSAN